jgi:transcription elongation factor
MRNTINESCAIIGEFKTYYGLVSEDGSMEMLLKSFIDKLCLAKSGMRDIKRYDDYVKIINGLSYNIRGIEIGGRVHFSYSPYS